MKSFCEFHARRYGDRKGNMKTETEIAKENVETLKYYEEEYRDSVDSKRITKDIITNKYNRIIGISESHLSTLKRWLEFLENCLACIRDCRIDKISDIKQAIKVYAKGGIK